MSTLKITDADLPAHPKEEAMSGASFLKKITQRMSIKSTTAPTKFGQKRNLNYEVANTHTA